MNRKTPTYLALEDALFNRAFLLFEVGSFAKEAEFVISAHEEGYIFLEEGQELFRSSQGHDPKTAEEFLLQVHHFFQWKYLLTLENQSLKISPEDYEIQFFEVESPYQKDQRPQQIDWQEGIQLQSTTFDGQSQRLAFQVSITNTGARRLFVHSFALFRDYSISNAYLGGIVVAPGETIWLQDTLNEEVYQNILIDTPKWLERNATDRFSIHLKFFFHEDVFNTDSLNQGGIRNFPLHTWSDLPYFLSSDHFTTEQISIEVKIERYLASLKDQIRNDIAQDKTEVVLDTLLNKINTKRTAFADALLLAIQYYTIEKTNHQTVGNTYNLDTYKNRIVEAILLLIDNIQEKDLEHSNSLPNKDFSLKLAIPYLYLTRGRIESAVLELSKSFPNEDKVILQQGNLVKILLDKGLNKIVFNVFLESLIKIGRAIIELILQLNTENQELAQGKISIYESNEVQAIQSEVRILIENASSISNLPFSRINPASSVYNDLIISSSLFHLSSFENNRKNKLLKAEEINSIRNRSYMGILTTINDITIHDLESTTSTSSTTINEIKELLKSRNLAEAISILSSKGDANDKTIIEIKSQYNQIFKEKIQVIAEMQTTFYDQDRRNRYFDLCNREINLIQAILTFINGATAEDLFEDYETVNEQIANEQLAEIKQLLETGNLDEVFQKLKSYANPLENRIDLSMQIRNYTVFRRNTEKGVLTREEETAERNQLVSKLIDYIFIIEDKIINSFEESDFSNKENLPQTQSLHEQLYLLVEHDRIPEAFDLFINELKKHKNSFLNEVEVLKKDFSELQKARILEWRRNTRVKENKIVHELLQFINRFEA